MIDLVKRAASSQAGIIDGLNPVKFDSTDPIKLWIVQVGIILIFTQLLAYPLARLRQPKVIAEVIGGVILGPTVMGRIHGFTPNIFPSASLPFLNLTATISLVLYLFLIGLEIDVGTMKRNLRSATLISAAGIIVPFGIGAGISVPLYHHFVNEDKVSLGHFLLFTCVAMSITAFPVLCRILTDLKLLENKIGIVVLAAGVGNDVIGWVLLALTVALVNATSGVSAVYVLLAGVAWVFFMLYPVKYAFRWLAKKSGSLETGQPSAVLMSVTFFVVFISAFYTDIIGIHAIFGGFLAGLVIPHENGFAIAIVEKIEDVVVILLLPIYFTLSGLKTNLGLLNNGVTWGYTILLIVVAFVGKFVGCAASARISGFNARESGAIGSLMSCKGLVELIVLNVGLQAGLLDQRLFSMFVLMALVLTMMTTPLTLWMYPPRVRGRMQLERIDSASLSVTSLKQEDSGSKFSLVLERVDQLPGVMSVMHLFNPPTSANRQFITVDALRLVELSDRASAVMRGSEIEELLRRDPIAKVLRTFGRLNHIAVSSLSLTVVPQSKFAESVASFGRSKSAELIVLPWSITQGTTHLSDADKPASTSYNPLQYLFGNGQVSGDADVQYTQFIRQVFVGASSDVGLLVEREREESLSLDPTQHLVVPFFGGPDDRLAVEIAVGLAKQNLGVIKATIIKVTRVADDAESVGGKEQHMENPTVASVSLPGFPDTVYAQPTTQTRLISQTADEMAWSRLAKDQGDNASSNISLVEHQSAKPLHAILERISEISSTSRNLLVIVGRARQMAAQSHYAEMLQFSAGPHGQSLSSAGLLRKTVGDVGAVVIAMTGHQVLVLQSKHIRVESGDA
ncbi:Sodium/hydrogen exchanger family-domain-containing protein [Cantharellus anzutake]|uniref:Sodium/hydrogen exchanger family-domain-containing protein n=1 Tax=Cantharellus anzutake TaxID=1750568 RepID=UPI001903B256|nr:Sodium/hydrogen exchanger family-domain-containing protein [Cantharellus anzutake]KAF8336424.1 Sodium/hydrogen exchanger family-domain-containing protein [Cantharellus anzutake]